MRVVPCRREMGQWDPELRASAEARQASKQASRKQDKAATGKARNDKRAHRTTKMRWGEEGEEQKNSV